MKIEIIIVFESKLLDTFSSPDGQKPECRLSNNRGKNLFTI